ncbi:MAG: hypothetical protein ABIL49_05210 [candidate division WOR-3 bacterium]
MKKLILIILIGVVSCTDAGLPGSPRILKLEAISNGDSLRVYWSSIEGADYYRVYVDDKIIYEGKDTFLNLGYTQNFKVETIGLSDKLSTDYNLTDKFYIDSLFVIPQMEVLSFIFPKFTIYPISDSSKYQQFVLFFAQDSSKINVPEFNKDSLKIFSASLYFNKLTRHKIAYYNNEKVIPFPDKDTLNLIFKKDYVLWFNPDTIGWDAQRDYFIKFRIDTLIFEVDSLNDTTYRLKFKYDVRIISGLRWF